MRTLKILLIFALVIGLFSFNYANDKGKCKKKRKLTITGQVIKYTKCKSEYDSGYTPVITPDSLSCIDYAYDESNKKLSIKHINAGFNCCPDSLYCNVSASKDTIIIQEFQKKNGCKCNCLYDLDIVLNGVQAEKYIIKFVEPFANDQEKLMFKLDLTKENQGLFTAIRKKYPWGRSANQ
ncbi:MAG TPA: hypothetical protein PKK00_04720 [Bacteroidales bacterium]|nr:hypothetical protein [Bacteroidales bacterium]HPS16768.1 hypothetical protein [Bacteroidales bacterium]